LHRSLKRKLAIGGTAVTVAACAGGAYAATQSSGPTSRQAFLNDVAKRLHVTPQQLSQALNGAFDDQLQAAVKDGRLTQAQANALEQRLKQKGIAPVLPFRFFGRPGLGGPRPFGGPGLFGGPGPFGGLGLFAFGPGNLDAAASYLGLTTPQLFRELGGGKSLAQIASAQHKSVKGLEQAMTAAFKATLDKAVAAKRITAAQEQRILSRFQARLSDEVNRKGLAPMKTSRIPLPRWRGPYGAPAPNGPIPPSFSVPGGPPPPSA
jgi:AraC-like DNA-binding protein